MTDLSTPKKTIAEQRVEVVVASLERGRELEADPLEIAGTLLAELEAFDQANGLTLVGTIEFPIFDQDRGALGVGRVELFGRLAGLRTAKEKADELVAELEERSRAAGG